MRAHEYVLISTDDWAGVYYNGVLATEGHRIPVSDFADLIIENGGNITRFVSLECDYDWLSDLGNLPSTLKAVKFTEGHVLPALLLHAEEV